MNDYWWSAMRTLFVFLLGVGMTALAFHVTYPDKSAPQFCPVAGCAIVGVDTVDFWDKAYAAMIKYPHFRLFYGSQDSTDAEKWPQTIWAPPIWAPFEEDE